MMRRTSRAGLMISAIALGAMAAHGRPAPSAPTIRWSGHVWEVKDSAGGPAGPGPCVFSGGRRNVWVDQAGKLHLRITREGGDWRAAEVLCRAGLGYGRYEFAVDRVTPLGTNVVAGLFTWDDTEDAYANRELDFEYGVWGDPSAPNFQNVVQPYTGEGRMHRFAVPIDQPLVHTMEWRPDRVAFATYRVDPKGRRARLDAWSFVGSDIPKPGREKVHINLWMQRGEAPSGGRECEIVLAGFTYRP